MPIHPYTIDVDILVLKLDIPAQHTAQLREAVSDVVVRKVDEAVRQGGRLVVGLCEAGRDVSVVEEGDSVACSDPFLLEEIAVEGEGLERLPMREMRGQA